MLILSPGARSKHWNLLALSKWISILVPIMKQAIGFNLFVGLSDCTPSVVLALQIPNHGIKHIALPRLIGGLLLFPIGIKLSVLLVLQCSGQSFVFVDLIHNKL